MLTIKANNQLILTVYIQPNASKTEFAGLFDGKLKLKIKAPAVDDKANIAVLKFLAKTLNLANKDLSLINGEKARTKKILITVNNITQINQINQILSEYLS